MMGFNRYGAFEYKPGMGDVSLTGPVLLLVLVVAAGGGLYFWKKHKAKQDEEEEASSESVQTIQEAMEETS